MSTNACLVHAEAVFLKAIGLARAAARDRDLFAKNLFPLLGSNIASSIIFQQYS